MHLKIAAGLLALILSPLAVAESSGWESSTTSAIETQGYETLAPIRRRGRVACYAQNRRGQLFRAIGQHPRRVQRRAMEYCFQYSRYCRPMGCQRVR